MVRTAARRGSGAGATGSLGQLLPITPHTSKEFPASRLPAESARVRSNLTGGTRKDPGLGRGRGGAMEPTVQQFKVGDKVTTHKQGRNWRYGGEMTDGASGVIVRLAGEGVEVRLTDGDEWTYHPSELRHVSETPQFKVGDRVRVVRATLACTQNHVGSEGTIQEIGDSGNPCVHLDRPPLGTPDAFYHAPGGLELITTPTHPQTITLDGVTYTLTPVQEAPVVEEEREPKQGEVWRNIRGELCFIVKDYTYLSEPQNKFRPVSLRDADVCGLASVMWDSFRGGEFTYAYPTLAAAIADGALS